MTIFLTILAFIIILGLLVFVHELGHFLVAKAVGVKVEEFAFGFPPRLISKKRGETRYSINAIPLGGYVKMLGEDRDYDSPHSFSKKKARSRFAIIVAGVLMNIILAGVLLSVGYMVGMTPIALNPENLGGKQTHKVIIAAVNDNSPAKDAGLKPGDVILGFNSLDEFSNFTHANTGKKVNLNIDRRGQQISQDITISDNAEAPLGVAIADAPIVKLSFFKAIAAGFTDLYKTTTYLIVLFGQFFARLFTKAQLGNDVAGPVGIFSLTGQAVKMGFGYIIQLAALLSINLALVNILPFPALDGGRAWIVFLEGIFRRRVIRADIENILHTVGFIVLILFVVAVTFREVIGLIG